MVQDSFELRVLKALALGPQHAYGIRLRMQRGAPAVPPDSLQSALQLLESRGLVSSAWKPAQNARGAKIYSLTPAGRKLAG